MAGSRPFAHLTNAALKAHADRAARAVHSVPSDRSAALFELIAELRDEMIARLGGDDDGTSGVREPRRPLPGGSEASAELRSGAGNGPAR